MIIVRYINSILCWVFIIVDTAFWGTLSLLSIFISPGGTLSKFCERSWGRTILWACRIKVRVTGLENIRSDQVQIFASNHQSFFDIWVLCSIIPVRFGWIIKKELKKIPFLNAHMKIMGYVTIDRSNREKSLASMDQAAEQIRNGSRIIIFPEGTRSRDGTAAAGKKRPLSPLPQNAGPRDTHLHPRDREYNEAPFAAHQQRHHHPCHRGKTDSDDRLQRGRPRRGSH